MQGSWLTASCKYTIYSLDGANVNDTTELMREKERLKEEFEAAISELRLQYQNEQKSKAKLQDEYMALKEEYTKAVEAVENDRNLDPSEAKKRLQILEKQFVGGEQVTFILFK